MLLAWKSSEIAAALDAVARFTPIAISFGGLVIAFLGFRIDRANQKAAAKAVEDALQMKHKEARSQEIQAAIAEFAARLNARLEERSKASAALQFKTAMVLFFLIAGMGAYLWLTTKRLESTIQHDQLEGAIVKVLPGLMVKASGPAPPPAGVGSSGKTPPNHAKKKQRERVPMTSVTPSSDPLQ